MKCPKCGVESESAAPECPGCGLIFAKYSAQREREKKEAAEFLALTQSYPAKPTNPWPSRVAAGVLLLIWLGSLIWYYVEALNAREERIQIELRARSRAAAVEAAAPR